MINPHLWLTQDNMIYAINHEDQEGVVRCMLAIWRCWPTDDEVAAQNASDRYYKQLKFELLPKQDLEDRALTFLLNRGWQKSTTPKGDPELIGWVNGCKTCFGSYTSTCIRRFSDE